MTLPDTSADADAVNLLPFLNIIYPVSASVPVEGSLGIDGI
jgi:hypothetical protein